MRADRVLRMFMLLGCFVAILLATGMLFAGAVSVGVSIDEHYHVLDFRGWAWGADPEKNQFGVFGLSNQIFFHLVSMITGAESLGEVGFGASSFAARHVATGFLGAVTVLGVGGTVWVITRSRVLALWALAATFSIQPFLGHSMFNPKDIPIACGFSCLTFSSVLFASQLRDGICMRPRLIVMGLATVFGIWVGAGTRLLFIFVFVTQILVVICIFSVLSHLRGWQYTKILRSIGTWLLFAALGYLLIFFTNPCLTARPAKCNNAFEVLGVILSKTAAVQWTAPTLMAGRLETPVDAVFWMLPLLLFAGLPVFLLSLAVLGAVFAPENLKLGLFSTVRPGGWNKICTGFMVVIVLFQTLVVPLTVILLRQEIYDMQRQHLYSYASIAMLAGLGFSLVVNAQIVSVGRLHLYRWVVGVGGVFLLFVPLYEGARLWPYNYVYVNAIASIGGIEGRWETDYWAVSLREALEYVPKDQPFSAVGPYWAVKPFMADRGSSPQAVRAGSGEVHVIQAYRPGLGWNGLPADCRDIFKIERNIRGHVVPIAQTGICPESLGLGSSYADILAHDP